MSLQTYDVSLGLNKTQPINAQGRYIYYLKGSTPLINGGVTPSAAGNQAIKCVAGGTGASIVLMPGQSVRLPDNEKSPTAWQLTNYVNAEVITGQVLVGEGDFHDSNTSNTNFLKLDATFANNVTVTNTAAARVPVTADLTQTIPVAIAGNVNTVQGTMQFTNSFESALLSNVALPVVSAAENVNGVDVKQFITMGGAAAGAGFMALIAKATAPVTAIDGDVLEVIYNSGMATFFSKSQPNIRVPAGKGLWIYCQYDNANAQVSKSVLYSIL